jgi:hypothetical protein
LTIGVSQRVASHYKRGNPLVASIGTTIAKSPFRLLAIREGLPLASRDDRLRSAAKSLGANVYQS